ncbi:MAG: DinB family protein [Sphingobacteriales bacterium]|nr:MAG: DinB family protein [Sphingobacteriales bacterium]
MKQTDAFLKEIEQEAETTRKMLALVPDDKFEYKPHEKSMDMLRLATHIAELPGWVSMALTTDELDFDNNPYVYPKINNNKDLLAFFDQSLKNGRNELLKHDDAELSKDWTMRSSDTIYSVRPKGDVIRMSISQTIHHRAQLGVFLRLLDIPIPGSYGPSADEMKF